MNMPPKEKTIQFLAMSKTKNGVIFYPNEDIWSITDSNKKIMFSFKLPFNNKIIFEMKKVLKWYLENNSIRHSENMYWEFKKFTSFLLELSKEPIVAITDIDLINYRAHLGSIHEWKLGALAGFLKKWYEMGFSFITKSAYDYLFETKIKGNIKGKAVSIMDPLSGPYTDLEFEAIQTAINNAYTQKKLLTQDFLLIWLFMIYGSRPIQFAQLKIKDVIVIHKNNEISELLIKIPRAKNRKQLRSEFKTRIVPPTLAPLIHTYCQQIKQTFKMLLEDPEEAPLFPNLNEKDNSGILAYHLKSSDITLRIKTIFNNLNIFSERTGEKLCVLPRRFRYTLGTRAASEGHGELIIAEILDHTDIQNASVYIQATPAIIDRLDRAMAIHMAPLAQAFAGKVIHDKSKAVRSNDKEADIIDPSLNDTCTPSGKCGSYGFCNLLSPIACYTCSSFQAWTDGPHEALLMYLLKERERLLKLTDYRIASINDKTILAVAQVVLACRQYNQEIEILQ